MTELGDVLQQMADAMNLSVAEVEAAVLEINKAFTPRPINGELGRSRDDMQWLQAATTGDGHAVPRLYRGLECLASADPRPVRRTGIGETAGLGPVSRPFR